MDEKVDVEAAGARWSRRLPCVLKFWRRQEAAAALRAWHAGDQIVLCKQLDFSSCRNWTELNTEINN